MSEYKVNLLLSQLIQSLRSSASPEAYVETIQKGMQRSTSSHTVATQNCIRQVAQRSPSAEHFIAEYEKLKSKNVYCLGPFVELVSHITEDRKLRDLLEKINRKRAHESMTSNISASHVPAAIDSNISNDAPTEYVSEVRSQLIKHVAKGNKLNVLEQHSESQTKPRNINHKFPSMPDWNKICPNISFDFVTDANPAVSFGVLGSIPTSSQQNYLIEDLMHVFQGLEGLYIVPNPLAGPHEPRTFTLSDSIDSSLAAVVRQMLPLASHYSLVVRFVEEKSGFEFGKVNHALASAMRTLLQDYYLLIVQIETLHKQGICTLQRIWFCVQTTMHSMQLLASVADSINKSEAKGGKVLTLLHERTVRCIGNSQAHTLSFYLTASASKPYMAILEHWIYDGVINDPFEEFLVEDNEVIKKEELPLDYSADYWEKRYTIRRERIPMFLDKFADIILRTGKYLNVIRQCGKNITAPPRSSIFYTAKGRDYEPEIQKAYAFASKTLLEMLMEEYDLIGRLRSVKYYFLLEQGDFIVEFMDICDTELSQNIDDIVPTRLEFLLELVLRTSSANNDPYKDDMRTELLPYDLMFQMCKILSIQTQEEQEYKAPADKLHLSGLESFSFGCDVKWPVSLVLNRKAIACYQMIFRHLFYCKHVERLLCRVWICNKVAKSFPLSASQTYASAFALRQKMLNCVQNLEYYMMIEVIEPNWVVFLNNISKVTNVDEVLIFHSDFLDLCLKDCMLTNPQLLRTVNKIMDICVKFCQFIQSPEPPSSAASESESFEQNISKFDLQFTAVLLGLLDKISELDRSENNEKLLNVLYRLDFNSFYTARLRQLCQPMSDLALSEATESS